MFGLSFGELVIIAVLALLLLGPDKLPDAAKHAGKLMRQFRSATDDLKGQLEEEIYKEERKPKPLIVPPIAAPPVPGPAGPPPPATAENVPGLEAALAEPPQEEPKAAPPPPSN